MDTLNQPIVFDNGSGAIKAGIAGDTAPRVYFASYVGRPKHKRVLAGAVEHDYFIGKEADENRGLLKLRYAMEHGIVSNWDDMERIWAHLYAEELDIKSEDHPLLLTEAPLNPRVNREKAAQVFFETFNVPALYFSVQAVLALYASGKTTGVVLDSGDGVSHTVPIFNGFAVSSAIQRIDIAGRDVTEYLQQLLRREGVNLNTSAEKEIVRQIKEKHCYVALDPRKEEKEWAQRALLRSISGAISATAGSSTGTGSSTSASSTSTTDTFILPDGQPIRIQAEKFRAPELLFSPHIIGSESQSVSQMLATAIAKTDIDLRSSLYENIVLSGGTTLIRGFGDRLLADLKASTPRHTRLRIMAPPERKYSTFIGGSILAGLSTFRKMWVTADEYSENPNIVHTKCM